VGAGRQVTTFVTVGWFTEPWDAYIARGRLRAEGISSWIIHEHHIWANWMYSNALGGVKLQVLSQDAELGTFILERCWRGEYEEELDDEFGMEPARRCPSCGSTSFKEGVGVSHGLTPFALYVLMGVAYPPQKNTARCDTCRHRWRL